MNATNYCAQAMDDLRWLAGQHVNPVLHGTVRNIISKLDKAVKFRVPDYGKIFEVKNVCLYEQIKSYCPDLRLPFPVVALEWAVPDCTSLTDHLGGNHSNFHMARYDAIVCIASETTLNGVHSVLLEPMFRSIVDGSTRWMPMNFGAAFSVGQSEFRFFSQTSADLNTPDYLAYAVNDLTGEMTTFVHFLSALNCSNSAVSDAEPPSKKLNDKRQKSGKTPFYSYKVLTISAHASSQAQAACNGSGSHASPRVHLRRGHIRRLEHKNVWVNACVVGDKSRGIVEKEYKVTQ